MEVGTEGLGLDMDRDWDGGIKVDGRWWDGKVSHGEDSWSDVYLESTTVIYDCHSLINALSTTQHLICIFTGTHVGLQLEKAVKRMEGRGNHPTKKKLSSSRNCMLK